MWRALVAYLMLLDNPSVSIIKSRMRYGPNTTVNDRAPLDYAFTAHLYNSQRPEEVCVGSIISRWWIMDHCDDFIRYPYEYFKIGWYKGDPAITYRIKAKVRHRGYDRRDFNVKEFDAQLLYAAQNALLLHRSEKEIQFIPEITRPIRLNAEKTVPKKAHGVFVSTANATKKILSIVKLQRCNTFYESYFNAGEQMLVDASQLCINPKGVKFNHCCNSQALLVGDNILIGIMAWSTGCSKEFGVDPWVFSNIGYYIGWIKQHTDWEEFDRNYFKP